MVNADSNNVDAGRRLRRGRVVYGMKSVVPRVVGRVARLGIAAIMLPGVLACGKDGGTGPDDDDGALNGTLRATINGTAWSATGTIDARHYPNGHLTENSEPAFGIGGADPVAQYSRGIGIALREPALGSYTLAEGRAGFVAANLGSFFFFATDTDEGASGTVTITTFTESRIAGTRSRSRQLERRRLAQRPR